MRQQENINFNYCLQRHPAFARLDLQHQMWLADLLVHMRERGEDLAERLAELSPATHQSFQADLRASLDRSYSVEEYLEQLFFQKFPLLKTQSLGSQQAQMLRGIFDVELQETAERCFAQQLMVRFYKNLDDNSRILRPQASPRFFMAVRRSRSNSDENVDNWIKSIATTMGEGVANRLLEKRETLLADYHQVLDRHAAACHQAKTPAKLPSVDEAPAASSDDEIGMFFD